MSGNIWVMTPFGPFTLNIGHPAVPFMRCEVADWPDFGAVWDAIPRRAQRELEAAGIGEREISAPLVSEYIRAARIAGW